MKVMYGEYEIDDDLTRVDFERVHQWLTATYWSPGISPEKVKRAAANSCVVIGAYQGDAQVAYARVVSDTVRFAYVADVYVDERYRRKGISTAIIRFAQEHPKIADVPSIVLATRDAHDVYRRSGFVDLPNPENWMRWFRTAD